jgi:thiamine biosynthesis lipoprotein
MDARADALAPAAPVLSGSESLLRSAIQMDTLVTIQVAPATPAAEAAVAEALAWFPCVEAACSRFEPRSEVSQLGGRVGVPTPVSDILYEALAFALAVARASGGAFDPTVGHRMEAHGFNRDYQTGAVVASGIAAGARPTWRDVRLDAARRTVTLRQPLVLDLGAVAKGLAIDLAARTLAAAGIADFAVEAGGDVYLGGRNPTGDAWRVGVRHPRQPDATIATLRVSNAAVCTSGDYERRGTGGAHHLLDPATGHAPAALASVTVVAPTAMAADALATAAFVLGPRRGLRLLERHGAEGLLITPDLAEHATAGFGRYRP